MTEPTDVDNDVVVASRRRFLREGCALVGGQGTIATPKPVRSVGSFWPYAPTLFDYFRRAMPQNVPQSLDNDDVYAVSAYILNLTDCLPRTRRAMPRRFVRSGCRTETCLSAIRVPTSKPRHA